MIYRVLKSQKEKYGLTDDLIEKIDVFYASGKITKEQYDELMES